MQGDLLPIHVWLSGRSYRIRVAKGDEAEIREAIKKADEQITAFRQQYAGKDDQDFVAMCLLSYAAEGANAISDGRVLEKLKEMTARIDAALK